MCTNLSPGTILSAQEIADLFGGNPVPFLPTSGGRVTCGRFDPDLNPQAPTVVLVGRGTQRQRNARLLTDVGNTIPVFLRQGNMQFRFVGCFKATRYSEDSVTVKNNAHLAPNPTDIAGVLYLKRIS
ncbi:hypothetical protein EJV47_23050 [Hymenobacter gummosus]|uniref:Uncharacterized protein n=1 Tax=Hymenobacter gummosus TaxID=1776032 RepID=A0A431TX61_9BACT|nr:hypothetical protein [Hymenobacter gummosus]RTQ46035.1 hypothetical protein EJV47_23050 [Hymenobacter gummosus]